MNNQDTPLKEFRVAKRWSPEKGDFVYTVEQRFENTRMLSQKEVKTKYFRPLVEVDEEIARKNAEHYGVEFPTEEHDAFAEAEATLKEAKRKGIL